MNPELHRQHAANKAAKARIATGVPVICRAVADPVKRERPPLPCGATRRDRRAKPPPLIEAIEREHEVRMRCIHEAYAAEADRHRAYFAETMRELRQREKADLEECKACRRELLCEATDLGAGAADA